jgi:hypothetical protein
LRTLPVFGVACLILLPLAAASQTAVAPEMAPLQLSPAAAYEQAMHPLSTTRNSITNWSDTEVAALTVAIGNAAKECAAREAKDFSGSDLLDLAKLCALGQNWAAVVAPARLYLTAEGTKPQLTRAYWTLIDAELHLKDEQAALADALTMR